MYFDNWFAFLELQLLLKSWNIWNAAQPCARAQGCVHDDLRADGLRKNWQFRVGTWNVDSLTGRSGEVACMVILAQTTGQTEISQVMVTLDGTLDHRILQKSCSCLCGTIRSNRLRGCSMKSENELKKEGQGSSDWSVDANSGIAVVRWLDNSSVQLSSSHTAVEPITTIRCWDEKQHKYVDIPCPAIVKEYNEHMGGVDLFHMLMTLYKVDHKSPKWYRQVFCNKVTLRRQLMRRLCQLCVNILVFIHFNFLLVIDGLY